MTVTSGWDEHRQNLLKFSMLSFGLALALLILGLNWGSGGLPRHALGYTFDVTAAGLGMWLILLIGWWTMQRGKFDPFEFPVWFSLNVYGMAIVSIWLFQRDLVVLIPWLRLDPGPKMVGAVWLFGFALTCLWIGYIWTFRWLDKRPSLARARTGPIRLPLVFAIWLVIWLMSIASAMAGFGYLGAASSLLLAWTNYLALVQFIGWAAWSALMLHYLRQPTSGGWIWMIIALGSDVLLGLTLGSKRPVLTFMWVLMLAYYAMGKLPWRWAIVGFAMVILIIPAVNLIRVNLHGLDTGRGVEFRDRLGVVGESIQHVLARSPRTWSRETTDTFAARQSGLLQITASVLAVHPDSRPFMGLGLLRNFFQRLMPRLIWRDKPAGLDPLYDITGLYLGWSSSRSSIGQVADSYRAGNWPLVALWFLWIGALSAWLYRQGPGYGHAPGTVFYFLLLAHVITYDVDITTLSLRLVHMVPLFWIVIMYVMYAPAREAFRG